METALSKPVAPATKRMILDDLLVPLFELL